MAKRKESSLGPKHSLFRELERERHPRLFIRRMLEEEADRTPWEKAYHEHEAWEKLKAWADLAEKGHLAQKETALDAEFLEKVFGDALGYKSVSESPDNYHRQKQFTVPGAGPADGALGKFSSGQDKCPLAIIELKDIDTDLDHDKREGRTPVQQLWDYLNELPDCPWGILSNYITIRLYHRAAPRRAYEEFAVHEFREKSRFRQFYYLFEREGLLGNLLRPSRALELLKRTQERQKEVGPELYEDYSNQRSALIEHLVTVHKLPQDEAIHIAQKVLDRIIFVAFCEDRHLLPENSIDMAYKQLPRFYKVTNPRWQNFKALFGALDKGSTQQGIPPYNGGLFAPDPAVDDLELDDDWTHFFHRIGRYDFRDEVNVDVLGHLFEQSVTELEKLRVVGLFGKQAGPDGQPTMPKSAQRKRFGIYYTPPDFTRLIVENTLGELIRERVEPLADHRAKIGELRRIKVCDPACGSGAFLIAAYELLEDAYHEILRQMRAEDHEQAERLLEEMPDWILNDNLYGVDLSQEAVEITQLALWLRSARKGRKLSDLSHNIVCGNSLVDDPAVHPKAMDWASAFPGVFPRSQTIRAATVRERLPEPDTTNPLPDGRGSVQHGGAVAAGFDCVIGNPPWEKLSLKKREFFAFSPSVLNESNAEAARAQIENLEAANPEVASRWKTAQLGASAALKYARESGRYPLTGRGDINTYSLFAELARKIVAPTGRVGLLVPSGIATDDTTKEFFADLVEKQSLIALYDFENKEAVFPDVHRSFKFGVLLMGGGGKPFTDSDFVFFARNIADLDEKNRHISLTARDLKLLNPNTRTCPIFRSRRDAELTKAIYRRVPILVDENRKQGGNPWGIRLTTMFHQSGDAGLFVSPKKLKAHGLKLVGNHWRLRSGEPQYLPCYEAKMVQVYDHRAAHVRDEATNWLRRGQPDQASLVDHQNPEFVVLPRWWVEEKAVREALGSSPEPGLLSFRKVTSPTNQRTMIASFLPLCGLIDSQQLILFPEARATVSWRNRSCLLANLNTIVYDYAARQKLGGVNLNFFIVEQLPTLPPEAYAEKCPWSPKHTLERWISERVLKLTCTANDMIPLARAAGFEEGVHRWNEAERAKLRAELDAAYFILYGIDRDDVQYILSTFQGLRDENQAHGGSGPTRAAILEAYDAYRK